MKDGIIIQARTGSTRLANKILLPFDGLRRIIDIIIGNIKKHHGDKTIVLATTENAKDDVLEEIALNAGIKSYRGSEDDVLSRFIGAAQTHGIERVIRVCSDNPFLLADSFGQMFAAHDINGGDYVAYAFADGRPTIKSHLGLFAELTTLDALCRVAQKTDEKLYREHVTIYMYTHPEEFDIKLLPLPDELDGRHDLRFTLDTFSDFELLQNVYSRFVASRDRDVTTLLNIVGHDADCLRIMKENISNNQK